MALFPFSKYVNRAFSNLPENIRVRKWRNLSIRMFKNLCLSNNLVTTIPIHGGLRLDSDHPQREILLHVLWPYYQPRLIILSSARSPVYYLHADWETNLLSLLPRRIRWNELLLSEEMYIECVYSFSLLPEYKLLEGKGYISFVPPAPPTHHCLPGFLSCNRDTAYICSPQRILNEVELILIALHKQPYGMALTTPRFYPSQA